MNEQNQQPPEEGANSITEQKPTINKKGLFIILVIIVIIIVAGIWFYFYSSPKQESRNTSGDCILGELDCIDTLINGKIPNNEIEINPTINDKNIVINQPPNNKNSMLPIDQFNWVGILKDVSGGNATGEAKAGLIDSASEKNFNPPTLNKDGVTTEQEVKPSNKSKYVLVATFKELLEPTGNDFYEGWIVHQSPLDIISTGRVIEEEIGYMNLFSSENDLRDYDFYVLTLEPDDGDPAPAKHILEGILTER